MARITPIERIRKSLFCSGLATISLVIMMASSAFPQDCACCGSEVVRVCQMDKAAKSKGCNAKTVDINSAGEKSCCQTEAQPAQKSCCSTGESQGQSEPVAPDAPRDCSDCQIIQAFCATLPVFSKITISKIQSETICLPCDECPLTFHAVDLSDLSKTHISNSNCPPLQACPTPNSGLGCCQLTL